MTHILRHILVFKDVMRCSNRLYLKRQVNEPYLYSPRFVVTRVQMNKVATCTFREMCGGGITLTEPGSYARGRLGSGFLR